MQKMNRRVIFTTVKKNRILLLIFLPITVLDIIFSLLIFYQRREIKGIERSYLKMRNENSLSSLRGESLLLTAEGHIEKFKEFLPPQREFIKVVEDIFALAQEKGFTIERIDYTPQNLDTLNISHDSILLSAKGNYGQIKRFIGGLEMEKTVFSQEKLNLRKLSEEGDSLEMKLNLFLYLK